jgi:hypothetical protein
VPENRRPSGLFKRKSPRQAIPVMWNASEDSGSREDKQWTSIRTSGDSKWPPSSRLSPELSHRCVASAMLRGCRLLWPITSKDNYGRVLMRRREFLKNAASTVIAGSLGAR